MHLLIAQVKVGSISVVPLNKRGHILNPTWSANNTLAFELIVDDAAIHLFPVGATVPARKLIGVEKSNSSVFGFSKTISSRLPLWSKKNRNSIFFLYDQDNMPFSLGKMHAVEFDKTPYNLSDPNMIKLDRVIYQTSNIREYHTVIMGEIEYIFLRTQDLPELIFYTDQGEKIGKLSADGTLRQNKNQIIPGWPGNWLAIDEIISSFSVTTYGNIIICKGNDSNKKFILGQLNIMDYEANYRELAIRKLSDSVLLEPSFCPNDTNIIAYVERARNENKEDYHRLRLHHLDTQIDYLITDSLYKNVSNKISRPNSNSYVWHPSGSYIFYINTNLKRMVVAINLGSLPDTTPRVITTGIEYADQLAISPNGRYLAVMTQIADDDSGALGQLYILELEYR